MKLLCILSRDFAETLSQRARGEWVGGGRGGGGGDPKPVAAGMQIQMKLTPCPAVLAAFI